jgi:hypothetical protein
MKTQTITRLQLLLLNSRNERQKEALEATIEAYQNPKDWDGQAGTIAA